ncbi:putative bifunctional diguanylate cyclase/phosphodiesterase [Shinella kummerowiae]|uniref:putative bifunctional diguanylate cyclase/phosphodiesterase n=1 Tax=Shinella kummerowiae TaxID=417745 RepID=UPI0021B50788|nr:EAL domain-containing protein [Shinella kummerowiae]MCT7665733.1 EAL domain-containing protein [Shinella kummerowiae]
MFSKAKAILTIESGNPELVQAQLVAFTKQVPLLYFMLVTNTVALTVTHFNAAPLYLTLYIPSALYAVSLTRLVHWWFSRTRRYTHDEAVSRLRSTYRLTALLGAGFCAWSLSLFSYGDAYQQSHVAFYIANTVIGCIFCLMHLRAAALALTAIVLGPFTVFFAASGNPVFTALALNVALVTMAMVFILLTYYRDFGALIQSQKELTVRQAETQRLSDENHRLANLDSLTNLPNRRQFRAELERHIIEAEKNGTGLALGLIDLDGFKPVNDTFGHGIGDKLLIEVGERLSAFAGRGLFPARLGGDEFGIVFEGTPCPDRLRLLGEEICTALQEPYIFNGQTPRVSGSLGISILGDAGTTADRLFDRADFALYLAKQNFRGTTVVFSAEHEAEINEQGRIQQALLGADFESEMHLVFQPMVDADTNGISAYEALARWESPTLGPVPPGIFIRAAERAGIIGRLTEVLMRKALEAAQTWPAHIRLSINLSTRDVVSNKTVDALLDIIAGSGVDPKRLDVEVTETAVMRNFALAADNIRRFADHGIGIALDDFGTGHSSLSYVHKLPLTKIKIDRGFIVDITTNDLSRSIVKTIVDLSRNIGCVCVVEGMETQEQVVALRALGCRMMQGYYFARPQKLEDTLAYQVVSDSIVNVPVRKTG